MKVKDPNGKLARWALQLQAYDFEIVYSSGRKHADADSLSRNPRNEPPGEETIQEVMYAIRPILAEVELLRNRHFREAQQNDSKIREKIEILVNGTERDAKRRARNYVYENETLYKRTQPDGNERLTPVLPDSLVNDVIRLNHDSDSAAHLGAVKTAYKISQQYYFRRLWQRVRSYVKNCAVCQQAKERPTARQGLRTPLRTTNEIFADIQMDLYGPLIPSSKGYRYVLVIVDHLSKYVIAEPLKEATEERIPEILKLKILLRFGIPRAIHTDNGTCFTGGATAELYESLNIEHIKPAPYHPQSQGIVENFNHLLGNSLRAMILGKNQKSWHEKLPLLTFAYNSSVHASTGVSPFYVLHGIEPRLPAQAILKTDVLHSLRTTTLGEHMIKLRKRVLTNNQAMQRRNESLMNAGRKRVIFEPGDQVLVKEPKGKVRLGGKLEPRNRRGIVLERITNNAYRVTMLPKRGGVVREIIADVDRIQMFHQVDEGDGGPIESTTDRAEANLLTPETVTVDDVTASNHTQRPKRSAGLPRRFADYQMKAAEVVFKHVMPASIL